ncbi:MAG: BrnT family toxin [Candidatus Curtissbacteria bacterium]|nr:BrnT family toxin [Candidatus Curtissbacteria bacterium]
MKILPAPLSFEWDEGNIDKNLKKHEVTNQEAEEIFENKPLRVAEDVRHSHQEKRFRALGGTNRGRLLFLSFTIRKDKVRIISARDMNKKEVAVYEKT